MLDLNYVRENLEAVRAALAERGMPGEVLDQFAETDNERRRVIAESDRLNAERNAASREIGALMKDGKRDEADARRKAVNELKNRIGELDPTRACANYFQRFRIFLTPPSPSAKMNRLTLRLVAGASSRNLILSRRIMSISARRSACSIWNARPKLRVRVSRFFTAPARGSNAP